MEMAIRKDPAVSASPCSITPELSVTAFPFFAVLMLYRLCTWNTVPRLPVDAQWASVRGLARKPYENNL